MRDEVQEKLVIYTNKLFLFFNLHLNFFKKFHIYINYLLYIKKLFTILLVS